MARTLQEAQRDLAPYLERLLRSCQQAIGELKTLSPEAQAKWFPRTNANIVSDFWNMAVLRELDGDGRVRIDTKYSRHRFFIEEKWQLRLKKVDRFLTSCNISTQEELRFVNQVLANQQLSLFAPGEPVTNVTVGYQWDRLTDSVRVFVVCPNGRAYDWAFEIELPNDGSGLKVVPIPSPGPRTWTQRIVHKASSPRRKTG